MKTRAIIYGRNNNKNITKYQESINKAAVELALQDPNLLLSRQKLLTLARVKVNEVYSFKKGKSRSKQLDNPPTPKRPKTSENIRSKHISELEEDIKDLCDRLKYKEKMRDSANMSRNYKLCDQLTEEMSVLKGKRRECEKELNTWKRKQQQAAWYTLKKKGKSVHPESQSTSTTSYPSDTESDTDSTIHSHSTPAPSSISNSPLTSPPSSNANLVDTHSTEAVQVSQETPLNLVSTITQEISEIPVASSHLLSSNVSPPRESASPIDLSDTLPSVSSPCSVNSKSLSGKSSNSSCSSPGHSFH